MKYTRRNFIKLGGVALGALPVLSNFGFGRVQTNAPAWHSAELFEKLIGSEFTIYSGNSAESAILTGVRSYKTPDEKPGGECFSLEFELTSDDYEQNTYEMFHPSPGGFELFLVPGKRIKNESSLIAVINRI
jgi:hypothetical protein